MQQASDTLLRTVLSETRTIALVGFSANSRRPSHEVARYLLTKGYRVIPVNPGLAGQVFAGEAIRASLADCPAEVEMVDIFRRSEDAGAVVEEALNHLPQLRTVWMQIGVFDPAAIELARMRGLTVVWNKCPKIEIPRLFG